MMMRLLLALALASACFGQLTDFAVHAQPVFSFPATAGTVFSDPVFGTRLVRITDATDGNEGCMIRYSYWPALNADGTKVLFTCTHSGVAHYYVRALDPGTLAVGAKTELGFSFGDDTTWHRTDANLLYYHSATQLIAYNVATATATWTDTLTPAGHPTWQARQMHSTEDSALFSFHFVAGSSVAVGFGVYRPSDDTWVYLNENPAALCTGGGDVVDEVIVSQNGAWLYVRCDTGDAQIIRLSDGVNTSTAYPGHMDAGDDWFAVSWGGSNPIEYNIGIAKFDFATVTKTDLLMHGTGAPGGCYAGSDVHVSALSRAGTWVMNSEDCDNSSGDPTKRCNTETTCPFQREIYLMASNGSGAVRRLVHHRTGPLAGCYPSTYFCYAFASLGYDGALFAFNSTNGEEEVHVYVGRTGWTAARTQGPVTARGSATIR